MDDLDHNLLSAWHRVMEQCRSAPAEARRRWARTRKNTLQTPPRAWCLAVRAADTRIDEAINAWVDTEAVRAREAHEVTLTGEAVRRLCAPVCIDWPGLSLRDAAKKLGRHPESLRRWLPTRPGRSRAVRAEQAPPTWEHLSDASVPFQVQYVKAQSCGHFGVDVPIVWSPRLLDPNAWNGQSPHPIWGTLWQSLSKRIPDDYVLTVQREPRIRPYHSERRFRGWQWRCPGRIDTQTDGETTCGRLVQNLYVPLPIDTIGRWVGMEEGLEIGKILNHTNGDDLAPGRKRLDLSGPWFPGVDDPMLGRRSFACDQCWQIKRFSICDYRGWNEFVTYISGGLLYGREVDRPTWVKYERKRAKVSRKRGGKDGNALSRKRLTG